VNVALPLHLLDCSVLLQWPTAQLLVGRDDVDALLHPLKVVAGRNVTGYAQIYRAAMASFEDTFVATMFSNTESGLTSRVQILKWLNGILLTVSNVQ
jgi:hypothetical protein